MKIEFINYSEFQALEKPVPASKILPEWYKNMDSYIGDQKKPVTEYSPGIKNETLTTIKKCMPIFDTLSSGYILKTAADVFVEKTENDEIFFAWPMLDILGFHSPNQVENHPKVDYKNMQSIPKIKNFWGIKTPSGYSCLITAPFHLDTPISIFTGIVDTDTYSLPIEFPFVLNDSSFRGLIPAGTPFAQIIPFKRNEWEMSIDSIPHKKENEESFYKLHRNFFDRYKKTFWFKKSFK